MTWDGEYRTLKFSVESLENSVRALSQEDLEEAPDLREAEKLVDEIYAKVHHLSRDAQHDSLKIARVSRLKGVAAELAAELRRVANREQAKQDRAKLLGGYTRAVGKSSSSATGQLLREKDAAQQTLQQLDTTLEQAGETFGMLQRQKERLRTSYGLMGSVQRRFPQVTGTIARIRRKEVRNSVILAAFSGVCLLVCLMWLF